MLRDHGGPESDLRPVRRRREDGLPPAESRDDPRPGEPPVLPPGYKENNRELARKVLATSVVKYALKKVGTPFLYKPSRILGAMGTKNNQATIWYDTLDADNFDVYRPGIDGCFQC